jgi:protein SCO1/2
MPDLSRRTALIAAAGAALASPALTGPALADSGWNSVDVTGASPPLALDMTDAASGQTVTAANFRGKIVMLYLGYTFCPDVCPLTLGRVADVLDRLGKQAAQVRFLFVTVDPGRDTVPVLRNYVHAFGPEFVGLRGTPDAIERLARRYRLAYSVALPTATTPYEVTHSAAIYVFDRDGKARLLVPSLASTTPDIKGTVADLSRLIDGNEHRGWFSQFLSAL